MKLLFIFILNVLGCCWAAAQQLPASYFYLNKIPKTGYVLLDSGWKFHAGNNSSWANSSYNHNNWEHINPTTGIYYQPQLKRSDIEWLRLTIHVGKEIQGQTLALSVWQAGASEIFLNGKLLAQYGTVSAERDMEETYNPRFQPVSIPFSNDSIQILAVRYSFNRKNIVTKASEGIFQFAISTVADGWNKIFLPLVQGSAIYSIINGILLFMSIFHLFLYLTYQNHRVNLYLSLYTFFSFLFNSGNGFVTFTHQFSHIYFFTVCRFVGQSLSQVFFLFSVYALFYKRKDLWFKLLVAFSLSYLVIAFFSTSRAYWTYFTLLTFFVCSRILIISIQSKRKGLSGAKALLAGQIISILFIVLFTLDSVINLFGKGNLAVVINFVTSSFLFIIPPICISVILALRIAQTNRSLTQQLEEVGRLSQKTIVQEYEKQQLLSTQNERLEKEVAQRTSELKQSLDHLQSTQTQLIQSEKMASLGELTAGIAHEIQNPLNFVNNFSEVNTELIDELEQEANKGNIEEVKAIASDIKENEHKINFHGKRADAIVKGMLQHSRSNAGQKEPTDINALADEYLRLSYQGLRAKDKSFNADYKTDFDESIGKVNAVPQDIGRVLLNLYNNAFYAVSERQKAEGESYKPEVSVQTKKLSDKIEIKVADNGNGIPQKVLDKIFQPFFTTKPTGQGTGLGLSLSYDIIKAHGGEIKVETREGEGSSFIIQIQKTA